MPRWSAAFVSVDQPMRGMRSEPMLRPILDIPEALNAHRAADSELSFHPQSFRAIILYNASDCTSAESRGFADRHGSFHELRGDPP